MKFAAGLTVTGILSFIILEALKIIMVPVTTWVLGLLVWPSSWCWLLWCWAL